MPDLDVLVVGAGSTGLMLGGRLARLGVSARLVERDPVPRGQARATEVRPRTLEIFERLGIVDGWLREGQVLHAFRSLTPEGRELRVERFDQLDTPYPFSLNIPQRITERLLTEHLERHGGRVERGVELIALEQDAEAVTAVLRRGGQEETVRCRYVVGADGAHSRVCDAVRVPVVGGDYASAFVVAEVDGTWPYPRDEATVIVGPAGICWGAAFADGRFLIIADVPGDRAAGPPARDDLQHLADERCRGVAIRTVHWSARFHLHCRLARHFRRGRVFLAGDAAHVCSLFGGQGLNMGIQDADNLAWKLALVVGGWPPTACSTATRPNAAARHRASWPTPTAPIAGSSRATPPGRGQRSRTKRRSSAPPIRPPGAGSSRTPSSMSAIAAAPSSPRMAGGRPWTLRRATGSRAGASRATATTCSPLLLSGSRMRCDACACPSRCTRPMRIPCTWFDLTATSPSAPALPTSLPSPITSTKRSA